MEVTFLRFGARRHRAITPSFLLVGENDWGCKTPTKGARAAKEEAGELTEAWMQVGVKSGEGKGGRDEISSNHERQALRKSWPGVHSVESSKRCGCRAWRQAEGRDRAPAAVRQGDRRKVRAAGGKGGQGAGGGG